ncbi:Glutamate--tRNA ligase mitochondrial [Coniosporium tulheliwenetii]|uniref:Glutamate--tRNA ligase mitochondrial n=1 Tax=Coniosporium tulheliwenetii TaxID=3383036 RepID=A0ACC2YTV2_9PEZI|nr:Glutamate--tRNA ligase mitochondrial [Cladosporium sp. JES 115]
MAIHMRGMPQEAGKAVATESGPARTRFAPSPTGYLHLGSLRTALFNYLLAKATGGQFLLRIEDTDKVGRFWTIPDAERRLYEDLRWAGLQWDEGPEVGGPHGPYRQSERTPLYQSHAHKLLDSGHAYRCFCSAERLHQLAEQRAALGVATDYDRTCASIPKDESDERAAKGEQHVIRLLVPEDYPEFNDLVYGHVGRGKKKRRQDMVAYEDPILLKTDGLPTYHLANVVDDHHMKITHVIRGDEWLPATPKHLAMYDAFGWEPPQFAHVALLVDEKGRSSIGIFPETLVNFVALLGWSHNRGNDCMDMEKLIERFHTKFTKGNAKVKLDKLWFLQHKHAIRRIESGQTDDMVESIVKLVKETPETQGYEAMLRGRTLEDYRNAYLFSSGNPAPRPLSFQGLGATDLATIIRGLYEIPADQWNATSLKTRVEKIVADVITDIAEREGAKEADIKNMQKVVNGKVLHFLRSRIAHGQHGPNMSEVMELLGREETLRKFGPWEWQDSGDRPNGFIQE